MSNGLQQYLIAHRGNINGPNPERENHPDYVTESISAGYDAEIDVWLIDGQWSLGHDGPRWPVEIRFLRNPFFWCHAKNLEAFHGLLSFGANCFWHEEDRFTMTSFGYIWTYPGEKLTTKSICVMPEKGVDEATTRLSYGFCSDHLVKLEEILRNEGDVKNAFDKYEIR